uniref:Immunoglobulin V-set domain-containing protein n=1 Tax=Moschus moschiferus TaxID=68415 RepID=A0A8C6D6M2_MOSMO
TMGPKLLLLLLLGLVGQGSAGSLPEVLQAPVGSSILVQCHYRLQDVKARKVWCRVLPEGCQPLVTSAVNRSHILLPQLRALASSSGIFNILFFSLRNVLNKVLIQTYQPELIFWYMFQVLFLYQQD